jgi:hypothetical protein
MMFTHRHVYGPTYDATRMGWLCALGGTAEWYNAVEVSRMLEDASEAAFDAACDLPGDGFD